MTKKERGDEAFQHNQQKTKPVDIAASLDQWPLGEYEVSG